MAIVTLPLNLSYREFHWGVLDYELQEMSEPTGDTADRILGPSRWSAHLVSNDDMPLSEAARWEWLVLNLRGGNVLAIYDIVRKQPSGTMRGSPVLAASAAVGATSCQITTTGTLKLGDWFGIGTGFGTSQLVKVAADASPVTGTLTVTFNQPLRKAYAAGTAVVWDKPVAYMKRMNKQATLGQYGVQGTGQGGFTIDLMERFG